MTSNPDSIYFKDAQVFLELRTRDGFCHERKELFPGELESKEDGIFAKTPNIVYETNSFEIYTPRTSDTEHLLVLNVFIPSINSSLYAETSIPTYPPIIRVNLGHLPHPISMLSEKPVSMSWRRDTSFYYEFKITVHYENYYSNNTSEERSFDHKMVLGQLAQWQIDSLGPIHEYTLYGHKFYEIMKGKVDKDSVEYRKFRSIDFSLQNADPIFVDYVESRQFQTDYNSRMATNIVNGLGIFTAINHVDYIGYWLNQQSLDSLALGSITKNLKFTRWRNP
jgi:hypothetical protein